SFPEGLLIGEIIAVNNGSKNPAIEYVVEPAVAFSQIEEVLVILK
ncbi:MAG: rod shape-determining protein MreC, partial [Candidatus Omnitrophica bacterium]|nr:rod shape-determining protein MreC [Candidatus Omnitrophota bacterium]